MNQREHMICYQTVKYNFQKSPPQIPSHLTMLSSTFAVFEGMTAMSHATSKVQYAWTYCSSCGLQSNQSCLHVPSNGLKSNQI